MAGTGSQLQGFDVLHSRNSWPEGDVYFCSGWGSDSYDGKDPDYPLKTIGAALDKCRHQRDDSIYVYASPGDTTFPIDLDVEGVHLYGFPYGLHDSCNINPTGDTAGFKISATKVTIDGFYVGGGTNHGCVEIAGAGVKWLARITNCNFGWFRATPKYGISQFAGTTDSPYLVVEDCYFGHAITSHGIYLSNATRALLGTPGHGNVFNIDGGGKGIYIYGAGADLAGIYDNRFMMYADTKGLAITLSGGNAACFVDGNRAAYGTTSQSQRPYLDTGSAHWGLNSEGEAFALPATS